MNGNDNTSALEFLSAIFGNKPVNDLICIWQLNKTGPEEASTRHFYADITQAATFATRQKEAGTDVYFGVATVATKPRSGRGKHDAMAGIGGIHLDIDVAHPDKRVHKKGNLPPTIDAAVELVNSIELPVSMIVHSGYGIHAYWLFKDFWTFAGDNEAEERAEAAKLIEVWQRMFKWRAAKNKWDVDSVHDLTRVLRIPGTLNYKIAESPVLAAISYLDNDKRYTTADFEGLLDTLRAQLPKEKATSPQARVQASNVTQLKPDIDAPWKRVDITVDDNADIGAAIFEALTANSKKFKKTWERKRSDLPDQSRSSYDMALANLCIVNGLTDQETVNVMIAHRRKYGDPAHRIDYYQRTIFDAASVHRQARERITAAHAPADDYNILIDQLYTILGFRIEKIEKHLTQPPQFIMYFPGDKYVNLGDVLSLIEQSAFRRQIANGINHVVPRMKDDLWWPTSQKLLNLAEDRPVAESMTELGEIKEMLQQYLDEFLPVEICLMKHRQAAAHAQPAYLDNAICISALSFWKYAKHAFGFKKTKTELMTFLYRIGGERVVHTVRDERGNPKCVSVLSLPAKWTPKNIVKEDDPNAETDTEEKE